MNFPIGPAGSGKHDLINKFGLATISEHNVLILAPKFIVILFDIDVTGEITPFGEVKFQFHDVVVGNN